MDCLIIGKSIIVKRNKIDIIRTPQEPPTILPLPQNTMRTTWSVMIPVYNCINYLPYTLASVLAQDKGSEQMQIMVVDDASTDGNVKALVETIGKGRIDYYRQKQNVGSLRNFESCINLSVGYYIHILHGDDCVNAGFYDEIGGLFEEFSNVGAAFTSFEYMDENGKRMWNSPDIADTRGVLDNWLFSIARKQVIQPPAKVVKRSTYEKLGSFFAVHYGEDWLMWVRIAANFSVAYSPKVLAKYRVHQYNISFRSLKNAGNIKEIAKVIQLIKPYLPASTADAIINNSKRNFADYYARLSHKIYHDFENSGIAFSQAIGALQLHFNFTTVKQAFKLIVKLMIGYRKLKKLSAR